MVSIRQIVRKLSCFSNVESKTPKSIGADSPLNHISEQQSSPATRHSHADPMRQATTQQGRLAVLEPADKLPEKRHIFDSSQVKHRALDPEPAGASSRQTGPRLHFDVSKLPGQKLQVFDGIVSEQDFELMRLDPQFTGSTLLVKVEGKVLDQASELPTHAIFNDSHGQQKCVAVKDLADLPEKNLGIISMDLRSLASQLNNLENGSVFDQEIYCDCLYRLHEMMKAVIQPDDEAPVFPANPFKFFSARSYKVNMQGSTFTVESLATQEEISTLVPTSQGLEALAQMVSEKNSIEVETLKFEQSADHESIIQAALKDLKPGTAVGLIVEHQKNGHVTPLVLGASKPGERSMLVMDSTGGRFSSRDNIAAKPHFKTSEAFNEMIGRVANKAAKSGLNTQVYENTVAWQTDLLSCRGDAMVLLKDILLQCKSDGTEKTLTKAQQEGLSANSPLHIEGAKSFNLPGEWSKIVQRPAYPIHQNQGKVFSAKYGEKSSDARQQKYTQEVKLVEYEDMMATGMEKTKQLNLASVNKAYKMAEDLLTFLASSH